MGMGDMKRWFYLLLLGVCACQSPSQPKALTTAATEASKTELQDEGEKRVLVPQQVDMAALSARAVTPYTQGSVDFTLSDMLPLNSSSSGYTQKWEFFIYSRPYQVRIKFEISNFAFSKNEGKIKGYVKKVDDAGHDLGEKYDLNRSLKSGQWHAAKAGLSLDFDGYSLEFRGDHFHIAGTFEKGTFEFDVPLAAWKPGTGNVYFGNSTENVFKYSVLTKSVPILSGTMHLEDGDVSMEGYAYANHYAATVPVYDMFDELSDFRSRNDGFVAEFRYFVPSAKYDAEPFGFMFVAFDGETIFGAHEIGRETLETWLDDTFYGYEIAARQKISAEDHGNTAALTMLTANPKPTDPYANLPAFQRNVAQRFAKPIEYAIPIDFELDLNVDGMRAKIPSSGSYSITKMR